MSKNRSIAYLGLLVMFIGLLLFSTYGIGRVEQKYFTPFSFELFIGIVASMFFLIPGLQRLIPKKLELKHYLYLGVFVRLLLLFSEPNLSDDYFRYIWDGTLTKNGYNPFHYLPREVVEWENIESMGFTKELYNGFNSKNYYSVYPPVSQGIFWCSALIGNGNVFISGIVIRIFMILAELGSIFFLLKLLQRYRIPLKQSLFYILNPLILLEFTVNLHFEGFMILFLLGTIYCIEAKRTYIAGILWGLAICTKILPLAFLPLLVFRYKLLDSLKIGISAGVVSVLLFLPFYSDQMIPNIQDSLDKYFGFFFFNAGIPYFIRESYLFMGGEERILKELMPKLRGAFTVFVLMYSISIYFLKKTSMANYFFWAGLVYFLLAGILHPWYITILVPMGLLSKRYSGVVWSFAIFLSYSAYKNVNYKEDYYLIAIEFFILFAALLIEAFFRKKMVKQFFLETD